MPTLDFWYEFASSYSYPAAWRIERLAAEAHVGVRWRPFLLGPIFKAQGWTNSPFNLFPVKGRYMWRDLERLCADIGAPFRRPDPFPQSSLLAARAALSDAVAPLRAEFSRRVYAAEFAEGRQIGEAETIGAILAGLGLDPGAVIAEAQSEPVKQRLKDQTAEAERLGIFGAPAAVTEDGELFWGNDRLERAIAWAAGRRLGSNG